MPTKPKLKPILGFWIYTAGHKPVFAINAEHKAVLNYHFTESEVETVKRLMNICASKRQNLSFDPQGISIELVIDHSLAPPIVITKDVVNGERSWQRFDARGGYENQMTEEGSEQRVHMYDFCHTVGEAALLLKPFVPIFDIHREVSGGNIGQNDEESE